MSEQPQEVPGWKSDDQVADIVQKAVQDALAQHSAAGGAPGSISADQAQAMIDQALARQAEAHNAAMQQLAESMRGNVISAVPHNAGGIGTDIADTWSAFDQAQAHAADAAKLAQVS